MPDLVIRRVPGHHWVRPFIVWGRCERGHGWLYGCIRRDAWRVGPVGFGLMRMPYRRLLPKHLREHLEVGLARENTEGADRG